MARRSKVSPVARDACVSWGGSRYSAPRRYGGEAVWMREEGEQVAVFHGGERIAVHRKAARRHEVITVAEHHAGIPLGSPAHPKIQIRIREAAPTVEVWPLGAYESAVEGEGR